MSLMQATVAGPAALPVAGAPNGRLTVELKRDFRLGPGDAATFASLLESRPSVAVFLSNAWLSGFFAEPPAGTELALAVLREGNALRGVVPIAVRHGAKPVRVRLLGGGAGSDRTDLVAERGFEAACADRFLSWLDETLGKDVVLELRDVPSESALWGGIHRANAEGWLRLAFQPREVHSLPYLDAAELWSGRPRHSRSVEKHRRWLERRGSLRIERLEELDEVLHAFEALVRMLHKRWDGEGGSALDDPRLLRFHRHVLPRLLAEGRLRMIRLSSGLRTIAVFYGVATGGWWGYCLAGYDREWAGRIHLGQITLATAIDHAVQDGATEFDFLKGAHRVKYLWPVRERTTLEADVYSEAPGAQIARAAWAAREAAAGLVKSARGLLSRGPA